eukprot:CAMPEP_0179429310 /NCGR_PEP_ID=MMETSP0799-20121207/14720_1 /TAXON_ID=46947 /ORGANISM="Geminigera cryophila, Strain CCMP2564" /LENGTH=281 /DNA_ID=CAMNT_0021205153 /DNA_START=42 /DNA_END=887 /DNA_ORIENTATION=+
MFLPPLPLGIEFVACAASESSTGAAASSSAHTTTLANTWDRAYNWYPDTPGAYPDSKWDYYYSSGGLYDQAHTSSGAQVPDANTTSLAPTAWDRGYSWYPDTPGAYPDSKWDYYFSSGGLYDQAHTTSAAQVQGDSSQLVPAAHTSSLANPNSPDFVWDRGYGWYPETPGAYPASKWDWYYSTGGTYDQAHQLAVLPNTCAVGPSEKPKDAKPTPANPGHFLLCGHAVLLGAVDATTKLVQTGKIESWSGDFKNTAKGAACASSPVGGFIMREHILQEKTA